MGTQPRPDAGTPEASPGTTARGWWGVLRRTVRAVVGRHLLDEAGGVAFFALLAVFPALTALVVLYGLFAEPAILADHLAALSVLLPEDGLRLLEGQVHRLAAQERGALGAGAAVGLAAALWSANRATKALFRALTHVHGGRETRGLLALNALALAFTLGAAVFALLAMGAVVVLPAALGLLGLGGTTDLLLRLLRWPVLLTAMAVFLACVYRYGPCQAEPRWRWVSWGGAFATLAWLVLSAAFSWSVGVAGAGGAAYGPVGAVIGFVTWLWLSAAVVLVGAALNAELEHESGSRPRDRAGGSEGAGTAACSKA